MSEDETTVKAEHVRKMAEAVATEMISGDVDVDLRLAGLAEDDVVTLPEKNLRELADRAKAFPVRAAPVRYDPDTGEPRLREAVVDE